MKLIIIALIILLIITLIIKNNKEGFENNIIHVIQADNRPELDYLLLSQQVNKKSCASIGYTYLFINIDMKKYNEIHPATAKIYIMNDYIKKTDAKIVIFLDSDAWIQNTNGLNNIINNLLSNDKNGCFSRDPYLNINTFINSGSFILKVNDYTKNMYTTIINTLENDESSFKYKTNWPYDQFYISNFIFENKNVFDVFIPDILNTPDGKILRHNWYKNDKMYTDLNNLLNNKSLNNEEFTINDDIYDNSVFPNI